MGLVKKNPEKGNDWRYFFRKWDSQLHRILDFSIAEEIEEESATLEFEWMPVFRAEWYRPVLKNK